MAAGRVLVSRRRDYDVNSKKEYDYRYKNGSRGGVESTRGRDCDHDVGYKNGYNGYHSSSNGRDSGSRSRKGDFDDAPRVKNGEVSKHEAEDGVQVPLEKRRKFSPIVWDLKEKEVRISSKNRVLPASTTLSPPPSPPVLNVEELEVSSVKVVEGSVSKSPAVRSPSLVTEQFRSGDDREQGQVDEEEFGQVRNISSSRWASDSDSPRDIPLSDGEDTPKEEERFRSSSCSTNRSTPESGEICREGSEGDRSRLSGSVERGCSVLPLSDDECSKNELQNGDVMDIDETPDESAGVEEPAVPSHRSMNMLQGCRSVYEYERLNKINEGTYGIVYRARDKKTDETVALKKVKMNVGKDYLEYGFPMSSLREINILLSFNHPSIVNVKEVVMGNDLDSIFMVMEYMEHDLKGLMDKMKQMKQQRFSTSEVKCLMLQLLEGVKYLHDNWVLHRDLKTSNILLNNKGELKVCDLGLSRQYGSPLKPYTPLVVTLYYRAPELLLGAKQYSTAIDMWSVGCIMAELLTNEPLFQGKTEVEQLQKIFKVLGTPNETIWPGLSKLPGAKANFVKQPYNLLRKKFPVTSFTGSPVLSDSGFDLLNKLLTYDPAKRITVDAALNHEWFRDVPLAKSKEFMPTFPPQHARR